MIFHRYLCKRLPEGNGESYSLTQLVGNIHGFPLILVTDWDWGIAEQTPIPEVPLADTGAGYLGMDVDEMIGKWLRKTGGRLWSWFSWVNVGKPNWFVVRSGISWYVQGLIYLFFLGIVMIQLKRVVFVASERSYWGSLKLLPSEVWPNWMLSSGNLW